MLKGMLMGAGLVLLLVAAIGGTVYVMQPDEPLEIGAGDLGPGLAAALPEESRPKVFYHHVKPEFVVNLTGKGRPQFAMLEMSVAVNDEKALDIMEQNAPELRNDILMMLGEQDAQSLAGNSGKVALRERTSELVDELLTKHYAGGRVVDVYLTRFVVQ